MYFFTEPTHEALFTLLGMPVYPYALSAAIGALIALCMALSRTRKTGISASAVMTFAMFAVPLCALLARLAFCACRIVDVLDFGIGYIFRLDYGGFSIIGATLGVLLSAWIVKKIHRVSFTGLLDTVLPGLFILLAACRLAEGSTINGTGPEVRIEALQFMPLARQGLYGDMTYAVYMGEALTALVAGVMTQASSAPTMTALTTTGGSSARPRSFIRAVMRPAIRVASEPKMMSSGPFPPRRFARKQPANRPQAVSGKNQGRMQRASLTRHWIFP